VFPPDNPWNRDVSADPIDGRSSAYVASIGPNLHLHPDFGSNPSYGMPYIVVPASQPKLPVVFSEADESDPGPYPIAADAPVEGASDRHVLALQEGTCRLYEMYSASFGGGSWHAYSGAVRPAIERAASRRLDVGRRRGPPHPSGTRPLRRGSGGRHPARPALHGREHPARVRPPRTHFASSDTNPDLPPMGLRLRMKASFPTAGYSPEVQVILGGLKRYGMFVADNGSNWYISGASDPRWNDEALDDLKTIPGSAFEVVEAGPLHKP
jgi:hypothetical protein